MCCLWTRSLVNEKKSNAYASQRVSAFNPCLITLRRSVFDVQHNMWRAATIGAVSAERGILIHYIHLSTRFDRWMLPSDVTQYVRQRGSFTYRGGMPLVDQHVDALHPATQRYTEAIVLEVTPSEVRVRFTDQREDAWLPLARADVLLPHRSRTGRTYPFRQRKHQIWAERPRRHAMSINPVLATLSTTAQQQQPRTAAMSSPTLISADAVLAFSRSVLENEARYPQAEVRLARFLHDLWTRRAMLLARMGGDGNCLFRAVAHAVYADQELHMVVRSAVVTYMRLERAWFAPFIVGDDADFDHYLSNMALSGTWGDDPELQAACELYNRAAEIYAYDATGAGGATMLRVFNSTAGADHTSPLRGLRRRDGRERIAPLRLSYFGGGHYDAIEGPGWRESVLQVEPGVVEAAALHAAERRLRSALPRDGASASIQQADDVEVELATALAESRDAFDAGFSIEEEAARLASMSAATDAGGRDPAAVAPADHTLAPAPQPDGRPRPDQRAVEPRRYEIVNGASDASSASQRRAVPNSSAIPAPAAVGTAAPSLEDTILQNVLRASAAEADAASDATASAAIEAALLSEALAASTAGPAAVAMPAELSSIARPRHADADIEMQERRTAGDPGHVRGDTDALYEMALKMTEEEQVHHLLNGSAAFSAGASAAVEIGGSTLQAASTASGPSQDEEYDEDLMRAIAVSLGR